MGRPRGVNIKTIGQYDKLHTKKIKMYSGVENTSLYLIKETEHYYVSSEVWAFCSGKFKHKKKDFTLSVDLPVITDTKTIEFLKEHAWEDWVDKNKNDTDYSETVDYIKRVLPNHNIVFFYELESIISYFCSGIFLKYDSDGNIVEPSEMTIDRRKNITRKYNKFNFSPEVKVLFEDYTNEQDEKLKKEKFEIYYKADLDDQYKSNCLDSVMLEIGKNSICFPVAFTRETAEWHKEQYGTKCSYSHAGEIYFVQTEDTVYFSIGRHY